MIYGTVMWISDRTNLKTIHVELDKIHRLVCVSITRGNENVFCKCTVPLLDGNEEQGFGYYGLDNCCKIQRKSH